MAILVTKPSCAQELNHLYGYMVNLIPIMFRV